MNRKKLLDLLAEKTGLEKAEVEDQLVLFMDQLRSKLSEGKDFKIEGLGTFGIAGNDIVFQPDEKLSTEVNYKYAGMKPIELIGAYKESPEVTPEAGAAENESEKVPGVEEYREEIDTAAEPVKEEKKDIPKPPARKEKKPAAVKEESQKPVKEQVKKELEKVDAKKPAEKEKKPAATQSKTIKKGVSSRRKKEETDSLGKLLVAAVVVIAVGISGWMFYDLGYFGGSTNSESGNTVAESRVGESLNTVSGQPENSGEQGNKSAADSVTNEEMPAMGNTSEQDDTNSTSSITSIAEASRQSPYGLRGGASPNIEDGYTIVVHSLRDEAKVRRLNEELMQSGYRTVISRANIMDTTFWRLGLGRFRTIEDAQNASQTLPSPYKSNHFIKRIQ